MVASDIPELARSQYIGVPETDTVDIPPHVLKSVSNEKSICVSCAGPGAWQQKRKAADRSTTVTYLTTTTKNVGNGRKQLHVDEGNVILSQLVAACEAGNPLTRSSCYQLLSAKFGADSERPWVKVMAIESGVISPNLAQWLTRTLKRCGFSVRKESISQSVPVNSNRKEDEKRGCTLAVSCEMFASQLLAPFIVMDGKPHGYLAKRYLNWDGYASVHFQEKHWMDSHTAKKYLEQLSTCKCYPDECVGLILDHAAAHITDDVLVYSAKLGITIVFIPAGLTSILLAAFKRSYCAYKMRCDPGSGGKYKVYRDDIVIWIEEATKEAHKKQLPTRGITEAFRRYGQDPRE
ncbi:hypothetical protein ACHHYP_16833 [Achlya hypogyna]|uniref:DDE-1 domain-containing protein n=1 Tax=Achlya hypogyna TaxID=1202772 RepID=A0A1V9Y5Q5_ACHHY|nr:hypothetical protein ACHHYP_16833 [Achlya hypogyna]